MKQLQGDYPEKAASPYSHLEGLVAQGLGG